MRLIDADKINPRDVFAGASMFAVDVRNAVGELIKNQPTVDAVEVVRCRECKHYGYILTCGCSRIETSEYGIATMKPDDFCSYGERKEVSE